jgi:diguanylate cyclase (GGDEF)-like protein
MLAIAAAGSLIALQRQSQNRGIGQAVDGAEVVNELAVSRNVKPDDFVPGAVLASGSLTDLQGDVAVLQSRRVVIGLEVWRSDGTPVFTDSGHARGERTLPAAERVRMASGRVWVETDTAGERGTVTLDVFLPYRGPTGNVLGVVEVLLPQQQLIASIRRTTNYFLGCASVLFLAVAVGLLMLRRRLTRREYQARHDPLTGLLNRAALLEDAESVLAGASTGRPAALLVLDLDGFRAVNDTLGHAAGDALLAQVGASLRTAVIAGALAARLGGDEFAVLLPPTGADVPCLQDAANDLLMQLRASSFSVHGVALAVDASIGIAVAPLHGSSVEQLLQRGDVAMYQAKREHCGSTLYDPADDHHDVGQLGILVDLRRAIAEDELVLHYQPQVELRAGSVVGVEALLRWQHPERGLLAPGEFLPLAENTGLMHPLTAWVLRTAVAQAAAWRAAGRTLRVAVNVSPRSLLDGDLPRVVLAVLAEAGLPPDLLEIEITETAIMTDPKRAATVLGHLGAMGLKVSIDDFGAGYTSLSYLKTLPVKALKIDRSLVTGLIDHVEDEVVTEAVIGLGHRLGLLVLAEGVETEAAYRRLRQLSCDEVQGYLLTRPLPPIDLERWLDGWPARAGELTAEPTASGSASCAGAHVVLPRSRSALPSDVRSE